MRRRGFRLSSLLKLLLLVAVLAWPLTISVQAAWHYLGGLPVFFADTDTLTVDRQAEWVTPALAAELVALGRLPGSHSVFDDELFARLRQAYEDCPWVEEVAIWRDLPRDIGIRLTLRRPVAYVSLPGGGEPALVDAGGTRLPAGHYPRQRNRLGLPLVAGLGSAPPPVGQRWADPDLAECLFLVQSVCPDPALARWGVEEIRVARQNDRPCLELVTAMSGVIRWGSRRDDPAPGEPAWRLKLQRLREFQGRLAGEPFEELCLDREDPIYH